MSRRVSIIIYAPLFCGEVTTLYDCYQYLKKFGVDVDCYLVCPDIKILCWINRYMDLADINVLFDIPKTQFNYVITTPGYHIEQIVYKELIILDSTKFILKGDSFINFVDTLPNKIILGNSYNKQYFDNDYILYPTKIFFPRLKKQQGKGTLQYSNIRNNRNYVDYMPFAYDAMVYNRWFKVNNIFYENIGKLIFEFLFLDKKVFYSNKNKCLDDGLTYYLGLLGIDDQYSQPIKVDRKLLLDTFSMSDTDILLNLVR